MGKCDEVRRSATKCDEVWRSLAKFGRSLDRNDQVWSDNCECKDDQGPHENPPKLFVVGESKGGTGAGLKPPPPAFMSCGGTLPD